MGLSNITYPEEVWIEEYTREFEYIDRSNRFYSFPCDANGLVDVTEDFSTSYEYCLANVGTKFLDMGIIDMSHFERSCGYGTCVCGETVYLDADYGNGIDCDCGRIYNLSGQELAPRSQWDEYMNDDDRYMVSEMNGGYSDY